jgi:hypothetical protein
MADSSMIVRFWGVRFKKKYVLGETNKLTDLVQ